MPPDLLPLIGRDTQLRRTCSRHGGEYAGPCPLCRRGTDRFKVWPQIGRWACLGPEAGRAGCDLAGDAIQYLRRRDGLSYAGACAALGIEASFTTETQRVHSGCGEGRGRTPSSLFLSVDSAQTPHLCGQRSLSLEETSPPGAVWQAHGRAFVARCQDHLWREEGRRALAWLHGRGLADATLRAAGLGYQPQDEREGRALWGLPAGAGARSVWLPRGIVLPWESGGSLWRINVRRPLTAQQEAAGQPKYIGPAGFANALYGADALGIRRPAILVEGEIDALTILQAAPDLLTAVATGSTAGGRRGRWIERLAQAPFVLVAFDCDRKQAGGLPGAGDQAARWWLQTLPNALRWRPLLHDVNAMQVRGVSVRQWIAGGIEHATRTIARLSGRTGTDA